MNISSSRSGPSPLLSLPLGTKLLQPPLAVRASQKKYTTIIFDLGNVLVEWQPLTLIPQLFPARMQEASNLIQTLTTSPIWLDFDRGVAGITEVGEYGASFYNFDKAFTIEVISTLPYHLPAIAPMVNLYAYLRAQGYKIYILSNISSFYLHALLKHHTFLQFCDGLIASYAIHTNKPDRGIYNYLLQQFNLSPESALFIDDVEANIVGANNVGIDGIVSKNHEEVIQLLHALGIASKASITRFFQPTREAL